MPKDIFETTSSVDKTLVTTNTTILIGYIFIFQAKLENSLVKWALSLSLALYVLSLILLVWHLSRSPKRMKLFKELAEKTSNKYAGRIASFVEEILVPFARLKGKDEVLQRIAGVKSAKEHERLMRDLEKEIKDLESGTLKVPKSEAEERATRYVVEGFVEQVAHASRADHKTAFEMPLKEKHAKAKLRVDRLARKLRRHVFISASVFALTSIFLEILSK